VNLLDVHAFRPDVLQRLAGQMVRLEPQEQGLDQALACSYHRRGAPDVLQQQHAPSRLEDPDPLGNGPTVVGDRAEAETEQDGIEPVTGELEGLGVGLSQAHVPAQLVGAPSSLGQHG